MEGGWQGGGLVEGGGGGRTSARPLALRSRMFFLSLSIFSFTMATWRRGEYESRGGVEERGKRSGRIFSSMKATLLGWMPTLTVAPLAFSLWMRSM